MQEIVIKAADWDTAEIDSNETLVIKLGAQVVASYARGHYIGFVRWDVVV